MTSLPDPRRPATKLVVIGGVAVLAIVAAVLDSRRFDLRVPAVAEVGVGSRLTAA